MIGPTGAVRVMVATKPVDFRKGAEGLAALVREAMTADPFSGAVYVFRAKRADRVKLIFWDGTGMCLFAKRLEDGAFRWPNMQDGVHASDRRAALGTIGRARLATGSRGAGDRGASAAELICDRINQPDRKTRNARQPMIQSCHDGDGGHAS